MLTQRGVFFVTRAKDNLNYCGVQNLPKAKDPRVLKDPLIVLKPQTSRKDYPGRLRLVTARGEVDGEERAMEFLTNNLEWSVGSDADRYRCRWQIEVFFKQIKQTLQRADFLGPNGQCGQVAAVDGAAGLRAAVLLGVADELGAQFLALAHTAARRALAGARPVRVARTLWDSRG